MSKENETQDPQEGNKEGESEQREVRLTREQIRELEENAKKGKQAASLERELAFVKAGIDTDKGLGKFFFENYKGELNKDAVLSAAAELGIVEAQTKDPQITEEEKNSTRERQNVSQGAATQTDKPTKHPREEALDNALAAQKQGATMEQSGAAYLNTLVKRYAEGDKRAVRDPRESQG